MPFPACAIQGQTIDGLDVAGTAGYVAESMENCSKYCQDLDGCKAWTFHSTTKDCYQKSDLPTDTQANDLMWYGPEDCVGISEWNDERF